MMAEPGFVKLIQKLFSLTEYEARALLDHAEERDRRAVMERFEQRSLSSNVALSVAIALRDGDFTASLLKEVKAGSKYLEISTDGLHWRWDSEDFDRAESLAASAENFLLWQFDRRVKF